MKDSYTVYTWPDGWSIVRVLRLSMERISERHGPDGVLSERHALRFTGPHGDQVIIDYETQNNLFIQFEEEGAAGITGQLDNGVLLFVLLDHFGEMFSIYSFEERFFDGTAGFDHYQDAMIDTEKKRWRAFFITAMLWEHEVWPQRPGDALDSWAYIGWETTLLTLPVVVPNAMWLPWITGSGFPAVDMAQQAYDRQLELMAYVSNAQNSWYAESQKQDTLQAVEDWRSRWDTVARREFGVSHKGALKEHHNGDVNTLFSLLGAAVDSALRDTFGPLGITTKEVSESKFMWDIRSPPNYHDAGFTLELDQHDHVTAGGALYTLYDEEGDRISPMDVDPADDNLPATMRNLWFIAESQVDTWFKQHVTLGTLVFDDDLYQLMNERSPLWWKTPEFIAFMEALDEMPTGSGPEVTLQ